MITIDQIPTYIQWLLAVAGFIGIVLGGFFVFVGVFDKAKQNRNAQIKEAEARLTELFREEIAAQNMKIERQSKEIKEVRDANLQLMQENKTLWAVITKTDEKGKAYQQRAEQAIEQIASMHAFMQQSSKNSERLVEVLEKLAERFEIS